MPNKKQEKIHTNHIAIGFFLCILVSLPLVSHAQSPLVGKWVTIDDNTGKERSVVEIIPVGNKFIGKIVAFFPYEGEEKNPKCVPCTDHRKNQEIIGMQITNEMELKNDILEGEILDPENGKIYKCKIWLEDNTLKVRGYIVFLYRTQTWLPFEK